MYHWRIAHPEEFIGVTDLFKKSGLWNGKICEIQRRISTPLLLKHLITFYNKSEELCGFVTFAFMSDNAEKHMASTGINAADWRSGDNFWAVDFVIKPNEGGYKMMRGITRAVGLKTVRHFREKYQEIRELGVSS